MTAQYRVALPNSWQTAERWMHDAKFITLPQGNGAQLERTHPDQITLMFNHYKAITFCRPCYDGTNDTKLVVHGHVFTRPLVGTLSVVGGMIAHIGGDNVRFSVSRYNHGKSAVLIRLPSEDPGRPEGDPFVLDAKHNCVFTYGSRHVIGTTWWPNNCSRTDECPCSYCRAVRSRRLDAIAKAIAGELE